MDRYKGWLPILVALATIAVSWGTLKAITDDNRSRIEVVEKKLEERSLSIDATGAGRLILERLKQIDDRLDHIDKQLDRVEDKLHVR